MKRHFCTYFDSNYLPHFRSLHDSLLKHCQDFALYAFCMDNTCFEILTKLNLPSVNLVSIESFLKDDVELIAAAGNRSKIEFYFTCSPSMPIYVLNHFQDVNQITYLDADLYFFSDVEPLFQEIAQHSIAIIPHRFAWHGKYFEKYGKYNVGWITFSRTAEGLDCLQTWRKQCLDWCYDRYEDGKFADQKYLEVWPNQYKTLHIIQHIGANVASWNLGRYHVSENNGQVMINEVPLIFYHFTHLKEIKQGVYKTELSKYFTRSTPVIRQKIYGTYIESLIRFTVFEKQLKRGREEFRFRSIGFWIQKLSHWLRFILFPDYLTLKNGKIE